MGFSAAGPILSASCSRLLRLLASSSRTGTRPGCGYGHLAAVTASGTGRGIMKLDQRTDATLSAVLTGAALILLGFIVAGGFARLAPMP